MSLSLLYFFSEDTCVLIVALMNSTTFEHVYERFQKLFYFVNIKYSFS